MDRSAAPSHSRQAARRLTVAVTGGIGAGKSTVSRRLADHGAVVIDSDQLAREVVAPGTPGLAAVVAAFGTVVLSPDGGLNRAALAAVVFSDPQARSRLNALTHPLVRDRFNALREQAPIGAVVVNDIPLLVDLATAASFHLTLGVGAPLELRIHRLVGRGLDEADARARVAAQIGDDERRPLCDAWLLNDATEAELAVQVDQLWEHRIEPFRRNLIDGRPAEFGSPRESGPADLLTARLDRALELAGLAPGSFTRDKAARSLALKVALGPTELDLIKSELGTAGFFSVDDLGAVPERAADLPLRSADPYVSFNLHLTAR